MTARRGSIGRVCLVVRDEPGVTGTSRYVDRLRDGLLQRDIEVVELRTRPSSAGARALATLKRAGIDANAFLATYPLRLRWPAADVYHLTIQTYASCLPFGRPAGPTVVTVHDIVPHMTRADAELSGLRSPLHRRANALAMRGLSRADRLVTPSGWTRDQLTEALSIPAERITVAPLAVDHEVFRPLLPLTADFYARHDLPTDRRYVLNVGSEDPRKNVDAVIRAMPLIRRAAPDVVLLRVGAAYSPTRRAELTRLATELGVGDAVRYVGPVSDEELALLYNASAAMIMPSLYEGFGLPVLEAMACATPVVTTARSALAELANDAVARVVEPDDAAGLAGAVLDLLAGGERTAAQVERARGWAVGFTWDRTVDETIAAYGIARQSARAAAGRGAVAPSQAGG